MSSVVAISDRSARWLPLLVLLLAGWALRPVEARLAGAEAKLSPGLAGRGGALAVLGGGRALAAGGCWLRANLAWERRDESSTRLWVELTVAADDRPAYYWLNGARMIAYDFPAWQDPGVPAAGRERVRREHVAAALTWLQRGLGEPGRRAPLYLEMADLCWRGLGDREEAARFFRLAAEQPGAPWQAARLHAEMLRELGRPEEALAWLRAILPGLPADDPAARRDVVRQRIAELERETGG